MGCSLPGSSVRGILQARILEWVAIPFPRESSWPREWTQVSCLADRYFTASTTREALKMSLFPIYSGKVIFLNIEFKVDSSFLSAQEKCVAYFWPPWFLMGNPQYLNCLNLIGELSFPCCWSQYFFLHFSEVDFNVSWYGFLGVYFDRGSLCLLDLLSICLLANWGIILQLYPISPILEFQWHKYLIFGCSSMGPSERYSVCVLSIHHTGSFLLFCFQDHWFLSSVFPILPLSSPTEFSILAFV